MFNLLNARVPHEIAGCKKQEKVPGEPVDSEKDRKRMKERKKKGSKEGNKNRMLG